LSGHDAAGMKRRSRFPFDRRTTRAVVLTAVALSAVACGTVETYKAVPTIQCLRRQGWTVDPPRVVQGVTIVHSRGFGNFVGTTFSGTAVAKAMAKHLVPPKGRFYRVQNVLFFWRVTPSKRLRLLVEKCLLEAAPTRSHVL